MVAKVYSLSLVGLDSDLVEVEVDIQRGKNRVNIIGLPDKAVSEAQDRIIPAIKNSKYIFPKGHITVNLAPADIHKSGSYFDLPIIVGILIASKQIEKDIENMVFLGEVSLEGRFRGVNGVLSMVDSAYRKGFKKVLVPNQNRNEAELVSDIETIPIDNIDDVVEFFEDRFIVRPQVITKDSAKKSEKNSYDMKYVKGQEHAKRALEIAAAGNHNCLMIGTPGSGKTFLSRCFRSILPQMTYEEKIEVTRIVSAIGKLPADKYLIEKRPFRAPHHTSSQVSLVGGGSFPKPGEVTLAHRGVLFLDEFAEFPSRTLEALRQPLEDRFVQISRATGTLVFPANFMLVAAMNPCKCGYFGDPDKACTCTLIERQKYLRKISGPVMDRIDLQVKVNKVKIEKLTKSNLGEGSEKILNRVEEARKIQQTRFQDKKYDTNSDMSQPEIKKHINLSKSSMELLKSAIDSLNLTARSYYRVLKVSRTIADIELSDTVKKDHVAEALTYRL